MRALKLFRQSSDALNPSAFSLEAAESWALETARKLPPQPFRLTAFWHIDFIRQPVPQERKTRYTIRLAQSENYGLACGLEPAVADLNPDFVGKDVRQILNDGLCRDRIDRTALVDLIMGHLSESASEYITLDSTLRDKYVDRARIFANEAEKIIERKGLGTLKGGGARILVIGATAGVIGVLIKRGFDVSATDLSPAIVGMELGGVKVRNAEFANTSLMKKADLAIITGMTLPNRTLPGLMKLAKKYNTSTMIWAITGRNFGRYYIDHGADCVISDPSPFLLLPGPATFAIHRRDLP
jgi:hypothetical protein